MKKWILPGLMVLMILPLSAAAKQINIMGGVGFAFSDIEGAMVELGVELQMVKGFFLQLTADSYLDDQSGIGDYGYGWDNYILYYGGGLYAPMRVTARPYSLDLYSVLKLRVSRQMKVFGKAGVHATFYLQSYWDDYFGYSGPREEGVGTAFGLGVEQRLTDRLALLVGVNYKLIFDKAHWYTLSLGISYNINHSKFSAD